MWTISLGQIPPVCLGHSQMVKSVSGEGFPWPVLLRPKNGKCAISRRLLASGANATGPYELRQSRADSDSIFSDDWFRFSFLFCRGGGCYIVRLWERLVKLKVIGCMFCLRRVLSWFLCSLLSILFLPLFFSFVCFRCVVCFVVFFFCFVFFLFFLLSFFFIFFFPFFSS